MAEDEVKHRITLDAEQAIADYRQLAELSARLAKQTKDSGEAAEQAGAKERTREQKLRDLKTRITELIHEQDRFERELKRGTDQTELDRIAAERRQRQITRLSGVLQEHDRIQRRVSEATRASADDAKTSETSFAKLGSTLNGLAGGIVGVGGVLAAFRLVKAELQQIVDLQEKAFSSQVTLASADRSLKLNLAGESDETVAQVKTAAKRISSESGVGEAVITQALGAAISAAGGDTSAAIERTELAARVFADRPDQIGTFAGSLGDVSESIQSKDSVAALGFLNIIGGAARITDFGRLSKNAPPAVKGATGFGFKGSEAGALFSSLTFGSKDVTGEQSKTATIQFAQQLEQFFIDQGRPERGEAAIDALQQDPALGEQFISNLSVEAAARTPTRELIRDAGSSTAVNFKRNIKLFGDEEQLRNAGTRTLGRLESGDVERNAAVSRTLKSGTERLLNENVDAGMGGAIREDLAALLEASGEGALAGDIRAMQFNFGGGLQGGDAAFNRMIQLLQRRRTQLSSPQVFAAGFQGVQIPRSEQELDAAAAIGQTIDQLQELRGNTTVNIIGHQYNAEKAPAETDSGRSERF